MSAASRRRWRRASSTACSAALLLVGGCGGDEGAAPELPADVGAELAAQAADVHERLDAGDPAAAQAEAEELRTLTERAIGDGDVPPALADELRAGVARLVELTAAAVPPPAPPPAPPEPPPAPPAPQTEDDDKEKDDEKKDEEKKKEEKKDGKGEGGDGDG